MFSPLIKWDIYELTSVSNPLQSVKLRGRLRKLCLENNRNILVENHEKNEKKVRFAVPHGESITLIEKYLTKIIPDIKIESVRTNISNPILSKLKINLEDRYEL